MDTQFIDMDMDPTKLICASPYELNTDMETMLPTSLGVDVMLKDESSVTLQRLWDMSRGGVFYGAQSKVKLEMEEFSDLSPFVHPKPSSTNSVDELNTPIFDKDAFIFNVNDYTDDIFVKPESDILYENSCIITDNNQFKDLYLNTGKVQQNGNINSDVGNIVLHHTDINVFSPQSENGSAYSCQISPSLENTNATLYNNVDDNSALSVNRLSDDVSSATMMYRPFTSGLETPEDSNSNTSHESVKRPSHLSLNVNLRSNPESNLTTPSIIEEVVDLENANFNILDLVTNEDITYVNAEDIFTTPPSVVSDALANFNNAAAKQKQIPQKRPRKRRIYTDDDEDYVPPTKKNIVQRKKIIKEYSDSEPDSEVDVPSKPRAKTRGRPPKRTESVSSDCSKDSDASKYRELRDKNNEASRKSRLKRKTKELKLEKESDELLCHNIKLKAQVEELEKMVTNFRENLFKIMIKK